MSSESFLMKIITPVGVALEETVTSVTLPTSMGEVGILPQHAEYTAILGVGILSFTKGQADGNARRLVVAGGICQFAADTLSVLADSVDFAETVDRGSFAKERPQLVQIVDTGNTQMPEWQNAKERLDRIDAISSLIAH